jgi:hypothetical protein
MEYCIIGLDVKKYVYVCNILQPHLVFAMLREKEYYKFKNYHYQFTYDILDKMPDSNTIEVFRLTETREDTYELLDLTPIQYPAKKIYLIIPKESEIDRLLRQMETDNANHQKKQELIQAELKKINLNDRISYFLILSILMICLILSVILILKSKRVIVINDLLTDKP